MNTETPQHRALSEPGSVVVAGAAQGVGRVIAETLADAGPVVVVDIVGALDWSHPNVQFVRGSAADEMVTRRAAAAAEQAAPLVGWVNNADIFRDASLTTATARQLLELVAANLSLALAGSHTAVNHFLERARAGAIVNVSSHQAQRPVRGALPYATAKAAIEGLPEHSPSTTGRTASARTRSPSAPSRLPGSRSTGSPTPRSTRRWRACTPSGGSAHRSRSPTPSPSCCLRGRASSTV